MLGIVCFYFLCASLAAGARFLGGGAFFGREPFLEGRFYRDEVFGRRFNLPNYFICIGVGFLVECNYNSWVIEFIFSS